MQPIQAVLAIKAILKAGFASILETVSFLIYFQEKPHDRCIMIRDFC